MDIKKLKNKTKTLKKYFQVKIIGKTYFNNDIYAINKIFDKRFKWVIITAGIHAREHLTCDLICFFLNKLKKIKNLDYNISFIPLLNPDGAELVLNGLKNIKEKNNLFKINKSDNFLLYKANSRGVDLNNNFDANFNKKFSNKTSPSSQGYYGKCAFSEKESRALRDWTLKINPFLTLSYHLKGEEIYFDFFQNGQRFERDKKIAQVFAESTGYKIKSTQHISSGGYKDWCVKCLKIPALTIEVGSDKYSHPYPSSELKNIYTKNKNIFKDISDALKIFKSFKN